MAIKINEQQFVQNNTFMYEDRLKSSVSRFLSDLTPVFTTYYHINDAESTTDAGFIDVASILGWRSPIRFNKIENFPIYGIDQIVLQLDDTEAGLDTNYSDEAIIAPRTIKPYQNDFFIIPSLRGGAFVFRVTSIAYDTAISDSYYKINFQLEYINAEMFAQLERQTVKEYTCVITNIGTEDSAIIEKSTYNTITEIQKLYSWICDFYKALFYNERHNSFLYEFEPGLYMYDPLQTEFINKHGLFNEKNNLEVLILTEQYTDARRPYKYNKSVYKMIETKDLRILSRYPFILRPAITVRESSFSRWYESNIFMIDTVQAMPDDCRKMLTDEDCTNIRENISTEHECMNIITRYMHGENITINDIPLSLEDDIVAMSETNKVFFFTPILLYILRNAISQASK